MSWYRVHLTPQQVASHEPEALKEQFSTLYQRIASPEDVALFASSTLMGGIDFYFTPNCMPDMDCLIQYYQGEPCPAPEPEQVCLEVGRRPVGQALDQSS